MKSIFSLIGKILYKILGWTYDELPEYWFKKQVVVGFPHVSNMDTVLAFTYMKIAKIDAKLLVKAEWFFWPMSIFLKSLGGVPVKRDRSTGFVDKIVEEFNKSDKFILAMVPEGTRKNVARIRTGFWNIAKGANVPIVFWYLDNKEKRTKWLGYMMPGEVMEDDLLKIRDIYEKAGYKIPLNGHK